MDGNLTVSQASRVAAIGDNGARKLAATDALLGEQKHPQVESVDDRLQWRCLRRRLGRRRGRRGCVGGGCGAKEEAWPITTLFHHRRRKPRPGHRRSVCCSRSRAATASVRILTPKTPLPPQLEQSPSPTSTTRPIALSEPSRTEANLTKPFLTLPNLGRTLGAPWRTFAHLGEPRRASANLCEPRVWQHEPQRIPHRTREDLREY